MIARELLAILQAKEIYLSKPELLDRDYSLVFASDVMSDVLAMVQSNPEKTVLVTGLCNAQVIRTAEMLDLEMVIFCRNKIPNDDIIAVASDLHFNIFTTAYTMFTACGKLYQKGLRGTNEVCGS